MRVRGVGPRSAPEVGEGLLQAFSCPLAARVVLGQQPQDSLQVFHSTQRVAGAAANDPPVQEQERVLGLRSQGAGEVPHGPLVVIEECADIAALRESGWGDEDIHDAAQVVSYFNYINRIADSLGVDPEPEFRNWGAA